MLLPCIVPGRVIYKCVSVCAGYMSYNTEPRSAESDQEDIESEDDDEMSMNTESHVVGSGGHNNLVPYIVKLKACNYYGRVVKSSDCLVYYGSLTGCRGLKLTGSVIKVNDTRYVFVKIEDDRGNAVYHLVVKHGQFKAQGVVFEVQELTNVEGVHQFDSSTHDAVVNEITKYVSLAEDGRIIRLGHEFRCLEDDAREFMSVVQGSYEGFKIPSHRLGDARTHVVHGISDDEDVALVSDYTRSFFDMLSDIIDDLNDKESNVQAVGRHSEALLNSDGVDFSVRERVKLIMASRDTKINRIRENVTKLDMVDVGARELYPLDSFTVLAVGKLGSLLKFVDYIRQELMP